MYSNFKYNINEETGTIVVYMTVDDFKVEILSWLYGKEIFDVMSDVAVNTLDEVLVGYPSSIVGKAQLSTTDEWDEKFGLNLARKRLKEKIRILKGRFYDRLFKNCAKFYSNIIAPVRNANIKYNTLQGLDKK